MAQDLYIRVKVGLRDSDGAGILARRLEDPRAYTYVPDLWDWFVQKHPEGQIVGPDAAYLIARGAGWAGDPDKFCAAMVAAGYLAVIPEGFRVKGWKEWAGFHLEKQARDAERKRKSRGCHADVTVTSRGQTHENGASEGHCHSDPSHISDLSVSEGGAGGTPPVLHADSPVAASLPCTGSAKTYGVTLSQVTEWQHAYPGVDVLAELAKAKVWLEANPTRRKTHGGMARFLVSWLGRAQDSPRSASANDRGRQPVGQDFTQQPQFRR